jgi:hypothetical protein
MKSSTAVTRAEISREPPQPIRFEKRRTACFLYPMQKPLPGQFRTCSGTPAGSPDGRQSSTNVPINWSRAWCSGPLPPARRNFPISVRDVRPPELAFGWCSTIATPDRGSRTSRQTSPLALSYRTLAAMPFQPTSHRRVPGGRDRARTRSPDDVEFRMSNAFHYVRPRRSGGAPSPIRHLQIVVGRDYPPDLAKQGVRDPGRITVHGLTYLQNRAKSIKRTA